ncbi:glomulin isoform X1 [Pieris rapae]|uniref:glomulin isoform X1 n=1 Tax=Pieris rapae TaxID=64459 RepID=UPI001E280A35|nr:glomulin isoform X1 [Pieris rapae]
MDQNMDIVDLISSLLDAGKYKEALTVPKEEKFFNNFRDNCWDLISIVVSKIQNDTITLKPSLYGTCEQLLSLIIESGHHEEALLEFIEQIEVAKNDAQFSIILNPLQQLLLKLSTKRGRTLECCLNSISTYIEAIPVLDLNLEGKERLLMDSDPNVRRIIHVYSLLPPFYQPFIKELKTNYNENTVQIIASFLISLLGKPFVYIDLDPECNYNGQFRQCCSTIIEDICFLLKNILKLFPYLEDCYKESQKNHQAKTTESINDDFEDPFKHKEKINLTTLSGLYYIIFSEDFAVPDFAVPHIYSNQYITHIILISVVHLLSFVEYSPQTKALSLGTSILKRFPDNASHSLLTVPIHYKLCKILINVSIYSNYDGNRKQAVKLIEMYVNKFNYRGRILVLKYIIDNANHSGMIGYAITLYKNSLDQALKKIDIPECFTGAQLHAMIKKICYLPYGEESDLVELADQIISALNFLRYIVLKDLENKTGIKEFLNFIETDYLHKLRTGLNMSKAHYEAKLKEIDDCKKVQNKNVEVQINIVGTMLENIPTKNKKDIINSALNAFHLIEGLVGRLTECINLIKAQTNTQK